jgi:hypothetical protein
MPGLHADPSTAEIRQLTSAAITLIEMRRRASNSDEANSMRLQPTISRRRSGIHSGGSSIRTRSIGSFHHAICGSRPESFWSGCKAKSDGTRRSDSGNKSLARFMTWLYQGDAKLLLASLEIIRRTTSQILSAVQPEQATAQAAKSNRQYRGRLQRKHSCALPLNVHLQTSGDLLQKHSRSDPHLPLLILPMKRKLQMARGRPVQSGHSAFLKNF